jgi:hypothetical protein
LVGELPIADDQPSVSLANLPQLAIDILITSLGLTRVGIIGNGDTVVPFFGPGEGSEVVTGGLEGEFQRLPETGHN